MGPFQMLGALFNTTGTVIATVDKTVSRTSDIIDSGFDALDIPIKSGIAELRTAEVVEAAKRTVAEAKAHTEANAILATLKVPQVVKKA